MGVVNKGRWHQCAHAYKVANTYIINPVTFQTFTAAMDVNDRSIMSRLNHC